MQTNGRAIVIAGVLVALALVLSNRYVIAGTGTGAVVLINQWTGAVKICGIGGCATPDKAEL